MNPIEAIQRLEKLVNMDCGASRAAASVLLYAWNPNHPIRDLYVLDRANFQAAITVIENTFQNALREEISKICTSIDFAELASHYGKNGTAWQS